MARAIPLCLVAAALALAPLCVATAADKPYAKQVEAVVRTELDAWAKDPLVVLAIRESNQLHKGLGKDEVAALDKRWIAEHGHGPMIFDLLDRQASVLLRDRRENSKDVITEIIVMDSFGLNVAISDPTSDFYQGDEPKWQETFLKGPGAVFVDDIKLDESTQKVQTQISLSVVDPDSGAVIGAVTFGINLDQLKTTGG